MQIKYDLINGLGLLPNSSGSGGPQNPLYITATTYFYYDSGTLYLYVNGVVRQEWTTAVIGTPGSPMGLLLALTYP